MSLHHEHNTRLTPEKAAHGGAREGGGRRQKENRDPNLGESHSLSRQASRAEKKERDDYHQQQEELANPMGRSWGYHECTLLLTLVIGLVLHYGETPTDALRVASTIMKRSYENLHTLWTKWRSERLIYVVDSSGRGAGAVSHIDHAHHVPVEVIFLIIEYIRYTNAAGTGCTSTELQRCILAEQRISIPDRTLRSVLSSMGYHYGKGNVIGKMNDEWYAARIRTFLLQYSRAIVEQQQGRRVIVYTDESYVNVNHARKFTWYHPEAPEKNDVVRPSGKGKRLVLLHAFTQDGWLTRDSTIHNGRVDQCALSCELIYEADKGDGDYHDNMNGSIYMQWLSNRLLPSFAARYPGQKMILVFDNASYHHHRGPDWINPHRLKKAQMAAKLIELGISSISVERQKKGTLTMEQHAFDAASFSRHGGRHAPTLAELKAELMAYLSAHPGMNQTEVSKLFTAHGHELIYTPPYQPGVQPIERLWAYVKNHVAAQYKRGRTVPELILQTYQGFYGDGLQHAGVDAALCARVIGHSHSFCNLLIEQDDALSGTIDDLSTESAVVEPDIEEDINADMEPFPEADVEEDEQK
jgi:hypothetical protein